MKEAFWQTKDTKQGVLTISTKISVKNFCQIVLVFLWHQKQERD